MYVGWVPRLATDERFGVAELLVDERVRHFWDDQGAIATAIDGPESALAYDVYYLWGPDAEWGDRPDASGSPVVHETDRLLAALRPHLQ